MMLRAFAVWVEVCKYLQEFSVFDNRERAMAVRDPQRNFHAVAHLGILGPGSVGCEGTDLR